jgi:lipocalin
LPIFFQRRWVADTTADYTPTRDGGIAVHIRYCTDERFDDVTGRASSLPSG